MPMANDGVGTSRPNDVGDSKDGPVGNEEPTVPPTE